MASPPFHFFLLCALLFLSSSLARTPPRPKSLVLPITKDASTRQYLTHIKQRTPLVPVTLTVDLGGKFLWTNCEKGYTSSTIRPGGCRTPQCRLAGASPDCERCTWAPLGPGCTNTSQCWSFPENTVIRHAAGGELASDVVSLNSTDGKIPGRVFSVPEFLFFCAPSLIMGNLSKGVTGMAGLGRTKISLPFQLASAFKFKRKFSLCLSSSTRSNGVVLIGDGQYILRPDFNVSNFLIYTPLIINRVNIEVPVLRGKSSPEYYIGVQSIKINGKTVPINTTLLSINKQGFGGTKISTVNPYTVLETSIYNAVIKAFIKELSNATRVAPVAPFGVCFRSTSVGSTRVGPAVPPIDLVLQEKSVYWRIFGANSMVQVSKDVLCLGVVDGGEGTFITSIVIGGHQIEDNLLEFDIGRSRLGFSSSLLFRQTTCANFKFTSV